MASRPTYSSRQSTATVSSATCSLLSSSNTHTMTHSTAPTSPDIGSPGSTKKSWLNGHGLHGKMEPMLTVMEVSESPELQTGGFHRLSTLAETSHAGSESGRSRRPSADLSRGKSVKDRVGQWETTVSTSMSSAGPSTPTKRSLPQQPASAPRPTSPLRIPSKGGSITPTKTRRVPVPLTEPSRKSSYHLNPIPMDTSPVSTPTGPELKRGAGSAKRMIQQWETQPSSSSNGSPTRRTPSDRVLQPTKRLYSREYLDAKPLPVPSATPLSTSSYYSPASANKSPSRPPVSPRHLATPTRQMTASSSAGSLNSLTKKGKGKSPLKDMLDKFGGGIKDVGRKIKGKSKDKGQPMGRSPIQASREDLHFWEEPKYGSNGLPGGIVFSDRMGDKEMDRHDPNVIRSSAIFYLVPTPCSSVAPWGSWLTSHATLTSSHLKITYCPVFQDPKSGNSTPRRVLSGTNPTSSGLPVVPFASIPTPSPGQEPDVELQMKDCVEIRSLRREEVRGRGIPSAPEGIGTEVLEMVWSDGTKRYIGVEGVGGRLGWVSATWDVILASKPDGGVPNLPPPSPVQLAKNLSLRSDIAPLNPTSARPSISTHDATPELTAFRNRIASAEGRTPDTEEPRTIAPPVQKMGDMWLGTGTVGGNGSPVKRDSTASLRDSVAQMFETSPSPKLALIDPSPSRSHQQQQQQQQQQGRSEREESSMEKVAQWQQPGTHHLSVFSRTRGTPTFPPTEVDLRKTDTILSFDPNDLNPSRSASQVRRPVSVLTEDVQAAIERYQPGAALTAVEEVSDSMTMTMTMQPPTHISHVTFPKPAVGGMMMMGSSQPLHQLRQPLSPHPELPESSSVHSHGSGSGSGSGSTRTGTSMRTPLTAPESMSGHDPTRTPESTAPSIISKLEQHSDEHHSISRQVDNVQGDVRKVVGALTALIAASQFDRLDDTTKGIDDKLSDLALDVKAIENAMNLSSLAERGPPREDGSIQGLGMDDKLPELHRKLDGIAKVCEELLSRGVAPAAIGAGVGGAAGAVVGKLASSAMARDGSKASAASSSTAPPPMIRKGSLGLAHDEKEEQEAGQEVAAIMAELTGGSSHSVRPGSIQVLHDSSKPSSPTALTTAKALTPLPADTAKQVGEVLGLVKELKEARTLQTQQTSDIARYLNELNTWLEKFVNNSTKELVTLNHRLTAITGPDTPAGGEEGADEPRGPQGLADLVADMHAMQTEQKRRADAEGMVGQRLDMLLTMMGAEQERHAGQQNVLDQVTSILDRQRQENEVLLRALATDLTSEIRGERLRFVEAMQQATTMNISVHIEEFKKALGQEVAKSMSELGQMREEKKALEQNISDLFALKAKHGMASRANTKKGPPTPHHPVPPAQAHAPPSPHNAYPAAFGRGLPVVPGKR